MASKGDDLQSLGKRGEDVAGEALQRAGYRILERNYQCPLGEIDLVARQRRTLVFVEVKSGGGSGRGIRPRERVDLRKQRKLLQVAQFYMKAKGLQGASARFDVVEVSFPPGGPPTAEIFPNAFESPET